MPVLRTSSAVTRTSRGFGAERVLLACALGAGRTTGLGAGGLGGGRATVRPGPRRSSMVSTRGALVFLDCLWGRAGVRLVPRSWSAVRVITRGLLGPAEEDEDMGVSLIYR